MEVSRVRTSRNATVIETRQVQKIERISTVETQIITRADGKVERIVKKSENLPIESTNMLIMPTGGGDFNAIPEAAFREKTFQIAGKQNGDGHASSFFGTMRNRIFSGAQKTENVLNDNVKTTTETYQVVRQSQKMGFYTSNSGNGQSEATFPIQDTPHNQTDDSVLGKFMKFFNNKKDVDSDAVVITEIDSIPNDVKALPAIEPASKPKDGIIGKVTKSIKKRSEHKRNKKIGHIINELITSEESYVEKLRTAVESYLHQFDSRDIPADLKSKRLELFGNIEVIYGFHEVEFLTKLKELLPEPDPKEIADCFLVHKKMFTLYRTYNRNKPNSDGILELHCEFFKKWAELLSDPLGIDSHLMAPTQRLGKYILLMRDLLNTLDKSDEAAEDTAAAVAMLEAEMKMGNDLMALDATKGVPFKIINLGDLIYREKFTVSNEQEKYDGMVFLFKEAVMLTSIVFENRKEILQYKEIIYLCDVGLTECFQDPKMFQLWVKQRTKGSHTFRTRNPAVKDVWVKKISDHLNSELENLLSQQTKKPEKMIDLTEQKFIDVKPSEPKNKRKSLISSVFKKAKKNGTKSGET